jgi:hypothetical protein
MSSAQGHAKKYQRLTNSALVYERHIREKETECVGCVLSLAVNSCGHVTQLNFDDLTPFMQHMLG